MFLKTFLEKIRRIKISLKDNALFLTLFLELLFWRLKRKEAIKIAKSWADNWMHLMFLICKVQTINKFLAKSKTTFKGHHCYFKESNLRKENMILNTSPQFLEVSTMTTNENKFENFQTLQFCFVFLTLWGYEFLR